MTDRDRVTVRRALRAGALVAMVVGAALGVLFGQAGLRLGTVGVLFGLVAGAITTSAWLLLATLLDLVVGERPSRKRLVWTAGAALVALTSPVLVLVAGRAG